MPETPRFRDARLTLHTGGSYPGLLVVKRLYDFSYAETDRFFSHSITLRQFCRLYLEPAPDDTTLMREREAVSWLPYR